MSGGLRKLLPLYLVVFVGFLGYSLMITVFTPMLLQNTNGMLAESSTTSDRTLVLGVLLCLYPLGQFLGSPVMGALSDRFGRRPVLIGSLSPSRASRCSWSPRSAPGCRRRTWSSPRGRSPTPRRPNSASACSATST